MQVVEQNNRGDGGATMRGDRAAAAAAAAAPCWSTVLLADAKCPGTALLAHAIAPPRNPTGPHVFSIRFACVCSGSGWIGGIRYGQCRSRQRAVGGSSATAGRG